MNRNFDKIIGGLISVFAIGLYLMTNSLGYDGFVNFISDYSNYPDVAGIKSFFSAAQFDTFQYILIALTIVGGLCFMYSRIISKIISKIGQAFVTLFSDIANSFQGLDVFTKGSFIGLILLNILVKTYYAATLPINHDEAMGYGLFASRGLLVSMSYYYTNNHILHHVLVNLFSWVPFDTAFSIRIPVLIPNILSVAAFFLIFKKYFNSFLTIILTTGYSFLFPILYYGYLSRGYSLVFLSFMLMFYAALGIISSKPQFKHFTVLTIGAIIGLYAHPTFIYPAFAVNVLLFLYVLSQKNIRLIKSHIISGIVVGICVILLYAPVLVFSGTKMLFGNAWVEQAMTRWDVLDGLYEQFMLAFKLIFSSKYAILIVLPIALLGLIAAKFSKEALFAFALILINPLVLLLQSLLVFDRYWIFLVVPTLFLLGYLLQAIKFPKSSLVKPATILTSLAIGSFLLFQFNKRVQYEELFSAYSKTISEYLVQNDCDKLYISHLHGVAIPRYYYIINDKVVQFNHNPHDGDLTPEAVQGYDFVLAKYEHKSLEGTYKKVFDFSTDHRTWENAILYQRMPAKELGQSDFQ